MQFNCVFDYDCELKRMQSVMSVVVPPVNDWKEINWYIGDDVPFVEGYLQLVHSKN